MDGHNPQLRDDNIDIELAHGGLNLEHVSSQDRMQFSRNSFEALDTARRDGQATSPNVDDAAGVPLPDGDSSSPSINQTAEIGELRARYRKYVNHLSRFFPHLVNVRRESRYPDATLDCIDFLGGERVASRSFEIDSADNDFNTAGQGSLCQALIGMNDDMTFDHRVLLATDLSTPLIEILGSTLDLSPEMFEEHLIGSCWGGRNEDSTPSPKFWLTGNAKKDYVSLKWHKPCLKAGIINYEASDRDQLIRGNDLKRLTLGNDLGKVEVIRSYLHNIFRSHKMFQLADEGNQTMPSAWAWEERATIWSGRRENKDIYPLPTVRETPTGIPAALAKVGFDPSSLQRVQTEQEAIDLDTLSSHNVTPASPRTRSRSSNARDSTPPQQFESSFGSRARSTFQFLLHWYFRLILDLPRIPRSRPKPNPITLPKVLSCLFHNFRVRPELEYHQIMRLDHEQGSTVDFQWLVSTGNSLQNMLEVMAPTCSIGTILLANWPLGSLFEILRQDMEDYLLLINLTLSELKQNMLESSVLMHGQIRWRQLILQSDVQLQEMESSLTKMAHFAKYIKVNHEEDENHKWSKEPRLRALIQRIKDQARQNEQFTTSLMAAMSIVESERGIAEAHGVTKLTELAFFFIPLSFSASIFSMQVKEINSGNVSIWVFFPVAAAVLILAYSMRLAIRSWFVSRKRDQLRSNILEYSAIAVGERIPTRAFLSWAWDQFGKIPGIGPWHSIRVVGLAILVVIMLAVIWTRTLTTEIKVGITIPICLLWVLAMVFASLLRRHRRAPSYN
ncbi:MAG: hypothetical protein Q9163_005334 [Psora crenata]